MKLETWNTEKKESNSRRGIFLYVSSFKFQVSGFSIVEAVIVLAVLAIIAAATTGVFGGLNREKALEGSATSALSLLLRARSLALSSKDASLYGVHFEERRMVLFRGGSYSGGAPDNRVEELPPTVRIFATALQGGGSDVVFQRLTGKTAQSGTITIALSSDASRTKTVTISATGIAETN
ncbi:MAG: Uncharacterized protein G01um101472_306 [Parcubacteria group bacterium Gr01-1014_72]|nr:MAG: Uncharacterized protein G01um101472_306 [Parcubacteria group bacterium Gr01-1014_72]